MTRWTLEGVELQPGPDPVRAPAVRQPQAGDLLDLPAHQLAGRMVRSAAAVKEAVLTPGQPAGQPAVVAAPTDAEGKAGSAHGHARLDGFEDLGSTPRRELGVGMTMDHGSPPVGWDFS